MSSDAEILSPRAGASGTEARAADPRRWAALVVMLLAAFMNLFALPARRGHRTPPESV